jgi:hypothetical protein
MPHSKHSPGPCSCALLSALHCDRQTMFAAEHAGQHTRCRAPYLGLVVSQTRELRSSTTPGIPCEKEVPTYVQAVSHCTQICHVHTLIRNTTQPCICFHPDVDGAACLPAPGHEGWRLISAITSALSLNCSCSNTAAPSDHVTHWNDSRVWFQMAFCATVDAVVHAMNLPCYAHAEAAEFVLRSGCTRLLERPNAPHQPLPDQHQW